MAPTLRHPAQKLSAARWLLSLEPQHPRTHYVRGGLASVEEVLSADGPVPDDGRARMLEGANRRHLRALELARQGPSRSPFHQARQCFELANYITDHGSIGMAAHARWNGLRPIDAASLVQEGEAVLRRIRSAGVLPMAWIEVRGVACCTCYAGQAAACLPAHLTAAGPPCNMAAPEGAAPALGAGE